MASTSTLEIKKMVTLKTSNNEEFYLEESLTLQSELIKNMVKQEGMSCISLPIMVKREALVKIIEYLKNYVEMTVSHGEFKNFKKDHLNVGFGELCDILVSADYLKIKNLVEICTQAIADKINNKSVEAVREMFRIESDYTPEEEAELRKETPWAFEGDEIDHTTD